MPRRRPSAAPEDSLQTLRARLRYIEQATPLGLWTWEVASGALQWSPGQTRLYGRSPRRPVRHVDEFLQLVHPDDRAGVWRDAQALLASGRALESEFRILRADGSVRWMSSRAQAHRGPGGDITHLSGLNLDVTEARQRTQALRLHDATVAHMSEGVILVSARTLAIVYANPRYEAMLGYAAGELLGQHAGIVNSPLDDDPTATAMRIKTEVERDGRWQGVLRNRRKDGRDIWVRASISAFDHPEHGPVWLNVNGDVTAEREAQQARDHAMAEVNRLASSMQQTVETERAAISRDVHDQLGAALTGIRLRLSALAARTGTAPTLAAELRDIAALAQAAGVQTREICSRLRPPALDDLGLVETCRWALREWSRDTGLGVTRRLGRLPQEPAPALAIDVFRVLQELLTNVARHAGATRVDVRLRARGPLLALCVADDGAGFRPAAATRGLGLVGVRERAGRHAGSVDIDSGAGGTTVTVSFTLAGRT